METVDRPYHVRSNSSPTPLSEPWAEDIVPSSISLITPCGGDPTCGFSEALEGIFPLETDYEAQDRAFIFEQPPTVSTLTPNKSSSQNLCPAPEESAGVVETANLQTSPQNTPTNYQKRGRFLVWPVNVEPPQLSLPFFGLSQ